MRIITKVFFIIFLSVLISCSEQIVMTPEQNAVIIVNAVREVSMELQARCKKIGGIRDITTRSYEYEIRDTAVKNGADTAQIFFSGENHSSYDAVTNFQLWKCQ